MAKPPSCWPLLLLCGVVFAAFPASGGEPPVALRAENLTVPPSTGPVMHVLVHNLRDAPYQGKIALQPPAGWRLNRAEQPVTLEPRQTMRVPFAIEKGTSLDANSYPVQVAATAAGARVARKQNIVCVSAPYFEPKIDGRTGDWADAIPVTFLCKGKKTVVSTYWNRRAFSILVEVEEAKLLPRRSKPSPEGFDAVQIALSPQGALTGSKPSDKAARYEFLLAPAAGLWARDRCFLLAKPAMPLSLALDARDLQPLECKEARVAVKRRKGITCYECAIPFSLMPHIKPTEGREYCFSLLVHDPDGTGVRDWGEAAGLWPWQRNRFAWCNWAQAHWGEDPPFDNKIEAGFCSSKR